MDERRLNETVSQSNIYPSSSTERWLFVIGQTAFAQAVIAVLLFFVFMVILALNRTMSIGDWSYTWTFQAIVEWTRNIAASIFFTAVFHYLAPLVESVILRAAKISLALAELATHQDLDGNGIVGNELAQKPAIDIGPYTGPVRIKDMRNVVKLTANGQTQMLLPDGGSISVIKSPSNYEVNSDHLAEFLIRVTNRDYDLETPHARTVWFSHRGKTGERIPTAMFVDGKIIKREEYDAFMDIAESRGFLQGRVSGEAGTWICSPLRMLDAMIESGYDLPALLESKIRKNADLDWEPATQTSPATLTGSENQPGDVKLVGG